MRGVLCIGCASQLNCDEWHAPGVARSLVLPDVAQAWLIDPWGQQHPIVDGTPVGRREGEHALIIVDKRVSADHAEFRCGEGQWIVRDKGSSNGTHVGQRRHVRETAISHLDAVCFGTLGFYFWSDADPVVENMARAVVPTARPRVGGYQLTGPGGEQLRLHTRPSYAPGTAPGGLTVWGPVLGDKEVSLSRLQCQFLEILCARAVRDASSPGIHGGYVATSELVARMQFLTPHPGAGHVRQVVKGLRKLLTAVGIAVRSDRDTIETMLIESAPRLGYRIAWQVEQVPLSDEALAAHSRGTSVIVEKSGTGVREGG